MAKAEIGCVVEAKAGRDEGGLFVIVEVVSKDYVKIADGRRRKLGNPKLKKLKHLALTDLKLEKIAVKLLEGKQVFDAEIKGALRSICGEEE